MDSVLGLVRHPGNDGLFRAIEMSLLSTLSGQPLHLHAEGLRGTGKTTIMRAVRRVLPRIRRIAGCLYNCDPEHPHCPQHAGLSRESAAALGEEWVRMPFLEISHSAKVGSAIGSIDLGRLVSPTEPQAALLPGTIPQAHRGIIFVDEINRLAETAPELADVLLDVMGTKPGRVQIEETGLPQVELSVQVSVWAASNPDEDPGPLEDVRRQLSDRFDFVVYTDRPGEAAVVEQILAVTEAPAWGRHEAESVSQPLTQFHSRLDERVSFLRSVAVTADLRRQVAELYSRYSLESLRAVQAMQAGMRLAACVEQRSEASTEDLARVATLALRHRVDQETMKKIAAHLSGLNPRPEMPGTPSPVGQGRPRFPNISFGAALVNPQQGEGDQQDHGPVSAGEPVATGERGTARDGTWPTQYPPRPRADTEGDTWLTRTLAGLRRNLGLGSAPEAQPARPRRHGNSRSGQRQGLSSARPGRFFQDAADPRSAAPESGPKTTYDAQGELRPPRPGQPLQSVDPLKVPPSAPPHAARPVTQISADSLVRTEEELDDR